MVELEAGLHSGSCTATMETQPLTTLSPALRDRITSTYCAICGSASSRRWDFSLGKEGQYILSTGRSCRSRTGDMRGHIRPRLCFSLSIHSLRKECLHLMKWGTWATISGALCQLRQRGLSRKQGHRKRCREHREHPGSTVWHPPQNSCKCWPLTAA